MRGCTLVCSLITLLWLGMVPPVFSNLTWCIMQVHSDLWLLHTHTSFLTSVFYPSLSASLAFSSQDKDSWCLACRYLIGKAPFTFPKARPYPPLCPCWQKSVFVSTSPCLFSFPLHLKKKELTLIRFVLSAEERGSGGGCLASCLFLLRSFLLKGLTMYFICIAQRCSHAFFLWSCFLWFPYTLFIII